MRTRKQTIAILLKLKEKGLLREVAGHLSKVSGEFALSARLDIGTGPIPLKVSKAVHRKWGDKFSAQRINDILQDIPVPDRPKLGLRGIYVLDDAGMGRVVRKHMLSSVPPSRRADVLRDYSDVESNVLGAHIRGRIFLNAGAITEDLPPGADPLSQKARLFDRELRKTLLHEVGHNIDNWRASPGYWRKQGSYLSGDEGFLRAVTGKRPSLPITEQDRSYAMERFAGLYEQWAMESRKFFETLEGYHSEYRAFGRLMRKKP